MLRLLKLLCLSALLPVSLLLTGCGDDSAESAASSGGRYGGGPSAMPSVEVVQARYGSLPLQERLSGVVRAENQVGIYPEISAPVLRVTAEDGDYVERGAPLIYLRDTQYREQLRQDEAALQIARAEAKRAEATLRELRSRLERAEQLAEKQFQSEQELEGLRAQVDGAEASHEQALGRIAQAEASVEEAQEALRRTVIRAPISGYVGQRDAEIGLRVTPSDRLYTIGNFDRVKVEVAITDRMIGLIEAGQTALITTETGVAEPIRAEVTRISPFLEAGSYSAQAQIEVPNESQRLRPGMFVAVDVLYGESTQATLVPASALYENPDTGALGVYVAPSLGLEIPVEEPETFDEDNPPPLVEPTPMTFREVEVLAQGREIVGIAGVQSGTWVVTVGQNLLDGVEGEQVQARARPVPWDRVALLQGLQDQDLLRQFMDKQQRLARDRFSEADTAPPTRPARATAAP